MTKIEYADVTWNPATGCSKISPGCKHCYAERMAKRLRGRFGYPKDDPFKVTLHPDRLDEPLHWRKPRRVFVCSMGDLFHEDVPYDFLASVYQTIWSAKQHCFLALTKRPDRMLDWHSRSAFLLNNPPANLWLGVTVENADYEWRIPILLQTPAAMHFVSIEPMLGPVDIESYLIVGQDRPTSVMRKGLDWLICGGESGPGARPMHPDWARQVRDDCVAAGVPFFFKRWGAWVDFQDATASEAVPASRICNGAIDTLPDGTEMIRVGKKAAGRLLDGREWNQWPEGAE